MKPATLYRETAARGAGFTKEQTEVEKVTINVLILGLLPDFPSTKVVVVGAITKMKTIR